MRRKIVTLGLALILLAPLVAFMPSENMSVKKSIGNYLMKYCIEKKFLSDKLYVEGLKFDHDAGIITLSISNDFAELEFTSKDIKKLTKGIKNPFLHVVCPCNILLKMPSFPITTDIVFGAT